MFSEQNEMSSVTRRGSECHVLLFKGRVDPVAAVSRVATMTGTIQGVNVHLHNATSARAEAELA